MSGPRVALAESAVPKKQTRSTSMWNIYIRSDLERTLRTTPGRTYQLVDPDTAKPLEVPNSDYTAMQRSAPRPYRLQARSLTPKKKGYKGPKHVWVSYDPEHWADVAARQARKANQ